MKAVVTMILLGGLYTSSFGQAVDSAEAYRLQVQQQRQITDAQIAWREAKKLSLLDAVPDIPQPTQDESLDPDKLEQGQIGKLSYWNLKVDSVVDGKNAILKLGSSRRIWLEGYPTAGLVDNQSVRIVDYVEVIGTKNYETTSGSKSTVRLVKMLPKEETSKRMANDAEKVKENAQYITWHQKGGKTVVGKFLAYRASTLTVEQKDGKKVSLRATVLTENDIELAKKLAKEQQTLPNTK